MKVTLLECPTERDWFEVYRRAMVTVGKDKLIDPGASWKYSILRARHSPIRYLRFSFLIEDVPSWVSVHLCRHVHAQPYVRSQRNDRQSDYDRNKAPQDAPVNMIWDMNAEELMVICNKRLCYKVSKETRAVVLEMSKLVRIACPEFSTMLLPYCADNAGECREMLPCGFQNKVKEIYDNERYGKPS